MRKYIQGTLIALLVAVVVIFATAFWYVRSGRFDLLLTRILIENATDYGARLEIGHLETELTNLGVRITDIRVFLIGSKDPIFVAPEITANAMMISLWRLDFGLENIRLLRPQVFIRFDQNGRSNLIGLHRKSKRALTPEEEREREKLRNQYAQAKIIDGTIFFGDSQHKIDGDLRGLAFDLTPGGKSPATQNQIAFNLDNAHFTFDNKRVENIRTKLIATFDDKRATVQSLTVESPISKSTLHGDVTSLKDAAYNLNVTTEFNLSEAGNIFAPDAGLAGTATFIGQVNGKGLNYEAKGELKCDNVAALKAGTSGLSLNFGLNGDSRLFNLDGKLALDSLHYGGIKASGLKADVTTTGDAIEVNQFSVNALGGQLSGKAQISLDKDSPSSLQADIKNFDIRQLIQSTAKRSAPITGGINGKADLNWKGTDFKTVEGHITASFAGKTRPSGENAKPAPFSGNADVTVHSDIYDIRTLKVSAGSSKLNASGSITSQQQSNFKIDFKSDDMAAAQQIAQSFGAIPEYIENYQLKMEGPGSFSGSIKGKISKPTVVGQISLSNIKARDESAGRFTASINTSPDLVKITNGSLVKSDGSRVDFSVDAPLHRKNAVTISASVKDFSLPFIAKSIDPDLSDNFALGGTINGSFSLSGFPGTDVPLVIGRSVPLGGIHGKLDLHTKGLTVRGESVERAGGTISLDDRQLSFTGLDVAFRGGQFNVSGSLNIQTLIYDINAKAEKISLDYFREASEKNGDSLPISGTINAELIGKGDFGQNDIGFKLTATGHDIKINNEPVVNPTFVAAAASGEIAKIELNATLRNQPHHITGTLDLLNADGPQIHAQENLDNVSLEPYLALTDSLPEGMTTKATGKITVDDLIADFGDPFANLTTAVDLQKLELSFAQSDGSNYSLHNSGQLKLNANPKQIDFNQFHLIGDGTDLTLTGTSSSAPETSSTLNVKGDVNLKLISALSNELGIPSLIAGGTATFAAKTEGSGDKTHLSGNVAIKDFSFKTAGGTVELTNGNGQMILGENGAQLQSMTVQSGGGKLTIGGGINLKGILPDRWRFDFNGNQIAMTFPKDVKTLVDGHLIYQGNDQVQSLTGDLNLLRAEYGRDLSELITNSRTDKAAVSNNRSGGLVLDITVRSHETPFIRINTAQTIGSANLRVFGPVGDPVISGQITFSQGTPVTK